MTRLKSAVVASHSAQLGAAGTAATAPPSCVGLACVLLLCCPPSCDAQVRARVQSAAVWSAELACHGSGGGFGLRMAWGCAKMTGGTGGKGDGTLLLWLLWLSSSLSSL